VIQKGLRTVCPENVQVKNFQNWLIFYEICEQRQSGTFLEYSVEKNNEVMCLVDPP